MSISLVLMLALSAVDCDGCRGEFVHPQKLPPFRGYADRDLDVFTEWEKLLRLAKIPAKEAQYVKDISWREDRWRNRVHRNPKVSGLFGQWGNKSPCPLVQVRWANKYAIKRYGSWRGAARAHKKKGWW